MATDLARKWKVDVDCGYPGAASWQPLYGITAFTPNVGEPTLQDNTDYDVVDGLSTQEVTLQAWSAECTFLRKKVSGVYPAAQEKIRLAALEIGDDRKVMIRYYDRNSEAEAYSILTNVTWVPANAAVADLDSITCNFTAAGARTTITNPLL